MKLNIAPGIASIAARLCIVGLSSITLSGLFSPVFSAPPEVTTAIIDVAKKNIPAVAHIEVTERQEIPNPFLPLERNPSFRDFFGNRKLPKKFKREVTGLGSGIIMDAQGHILTNFHVAGGATKIEVQLSNGDRYTAKLVGGDAKTDLAVIRIQPSEQIPIATFGDSDKAEVGEWVVAIGHPRGLDQTVTQGIISAKHRQGILDPSSYQDFLQTDAPINPGNSGGPLLNLKGEVIGINAVIASESGGSEGLGFAIPSNVALHIAKILISHGKVERSWLGVAVTNVKPQQAKSLGLANTKGALVEETVSGGPADKGGIKKGDVIVAFQGKEVPDAAALQNMATLSPIGEEVNIGFLRQGKRYEAKVRTAGMQEAGKVLGAAASEKLGAQFRELSPQEAEKLGLEPKQGVVVTSVDAKGPIGKAGVETGDLILQINGQTIDGIDSFSQLVSTLPPRQQVTLLVADPRQDAMGNVKVTVR